MCTNCGVENDPGSLFCGSCGFEIPGFQTRAGADGELASGGAVDAGIKIPPRDLNGLVQDTFRMYRDGFGFYVKIGLIAQIPLLVTTLIPMPFALTIIFTIAGLVVLLGSEGAIIAATAWHYLGIRPTVGQCYRRSWDRSWSVLLGAIVLGVVIAVCAVLSFFIIGIPLIFYFLVSRYFFLPAVILEDKGAIDALARSADLVKGTWWRVFGIGIFFAIVMLIMGIPGAIIGNANSTIGDLFTLIAGVIVFPISHIARTLVYFDLRTRKEGFTLGMLETEMGQGGKVSEKGWS